MTTKTSQAFLRLLQYLQRGTAQQLLEAYGDLYNQLALAGYTSWMDYVLDQVPGDRMGMAAPQIHMHMHHTHYIHHIHHIHVPHTRIGIPQHTSCFPPTYTLIHPPSSPPTTSPPRRSCLALKTHGPRGWPRETSLAPAPWIVLLHMTWMCCSSCVSRKVHWWLGSSRWHPPCLNHGGLQVCMLCCPHGITRATCFACAYPHPPPPIPTHPHSNITYKAHTPSSRQWQQQQQYKRQWQWWGERAVTE